MPRCEGLLIRKAAGSMALVPPDLLHRMLNDVVEGQAPTGASSRNQAVRRGIIARLKGRIRNRLSPPRPEVPRMKPADVLMRLLVLRMAFPTTFRIAKFLTQTNFVG